MTSTSESRMLDEVLAASHVEPGVWYRLHEDLWIRARTAPLVGLVDVELAGDFDDRNAEAVARTFHAIIGLGATSLHVDLAAVESFDGAGARTLASSAAELEAEGGRLRALNASGSVEGVLHSTGLGRLLIASRDASSSAPARYEIPDEASTRTG